MSWLAEWFPFTVDELQYAFESDGMSTSAAHATANAMAADIRRATVSGLHSVALFGSFLRPIASLSEDAAQRVAQFEAQHVRHSGFFWENGPQPDNAYFHDVDNCLAVVAAFGPSVPGFIECKQGPQRVVVTLAAGRYLPVFAEAADQLGIPPIMLTYLIGGSQSSP